MSAICRLAGRKVLSNLSQTQSSPLQLARAYQIKLLPRQDTPVGLSEHDANNARLGRPMSPHLTIYRPQLTSFLSITHRMTGMALSTYVYMLAAGPLFWKDYNSLVGAVAGLGPAAHLSLKFIIAFPFAYHIANGLRHLMWDSGRCLKLKQVYSTGYAMVASSLVITALLMAL